MKITGYLTILIVAAGLYTTSCSSGDSKKSTQDAATPAPDKGQLLFEARCAACHGTDGAAGIGNAANLAISKLDTAAIINTITNGKNAMPAFKEQLSGKEITLVAGYVYSLRNK